MSSLPKRPVFPVPVLQLSLSVTSPKLAVQASKWPLSASMSAMAKHRDAPANEARLVLVARATETHTHPFHFAAPIACGTVGNNYISVSNEWSALGANCYSSKSELSDPA